MIPNAFIVGAPKCGTTALAQYLSDHPSVFFSTPKEPMYWSDDLAVGRHELRAESRAEYLGLFDDADPSVHRVVAEGSTSYLRSRSAIPRILEFNPDARFIAMLRDPTEVVQAYHMEQCYVGVEDVEDFAEAWALQEQRERGESGPPDHGLIEHVCYRRVAAFGEQIERFVAAVPAPQRMIIVMDDFRDEPARVYADTLTFLDIDPDGRTAFDPVNLAHAQRFPRFARFVLHPPDPLVAPMKRVRSHLLAHDVPGAAAVKRLLRSERRRPPVPDDVLDAVRGHFAPDVARLGDLLGRDLSHWSTG